MFVFQFVAVPTGNRAREIGHDERTTNDCQVKTRGFPTDAKGNFSVVVTYGCCCDAKEQEELNTVTSLERRIKTKWRNKKPGRKVCAAFVDA